MESKQGSRGATCAATLGTKTIGAGCPPPANEGDWDGGWEDNLCPLEGGGGELGTWEDVGNRGRTVTSLGGRLGGRVGWEGNWDDVGNRGQTATNVGGRLGERVRWEKVGTESKQDRRLGES